MDGPLRDAYIAVGSAISDLRSLPIRRYAGDEEVLHINAAKQSLLEADASLRRICHELGRPPIVIAVEPEALGVMRFLARPSVWQWISELHRTREAIAALILEQGGTVPDDLPIGSGYEYWNWGKGSRGIYVAFALGIIITLAVLSAVMQLP